ncbi:hypothetical protein [Devosia sp. A369]
MATFKLIDNDLAQEIVDSVVVSIGPAAARVSNAMDGDVHTEEGYPILNGLVAAQRDAQSRQQPVIYIVLEPGARWDETWGALHPQD